jgi:excisionase family DNA binding protein
VSDRLLTARQVADLLAVPESWVREHSRGKDAAMPHVRLGRHVRYDRADVLAWVESCKSNGRTTAFRKAGPVPRGGTK